MSNFVPVIFYRSWIQILIWARVTEFGGGMYALLWYLLGVVGEIRRDKVLFLDKERWLLKGDSISKSSGWAW